LLSSKPMIVSPTKNLMGLAKDAIRFLDMNTLFNKDLSCN
jgi:hypothetical protein